MLDHFPPQHRPWFRDGRTWSMVRLGREVRFQTDYILGTYFHLFRNVAVRDPRNNSDHYMVLVCLLITPLMEHTEYLGRRTWLPLRPPTTPTREDRLFAALRSATPKPKVQEARKNTWILADTRRLVGDRVSARRGPTREKAILQHVGCAINASLKGDRRRQTE